MKTVTFLLILGFVIASATVPAAPSLKLKRYFALKVKPYNQSMFATQDRNGNYYLVGTTSTTEFDFNSKDWLVAKYSPAGVRLWYRTFNGKGNGGDIPGGVGVDRLGNVIVCGYTTGVAQEGSAGAVVKWDSNGTRRYVRYSPGTASAGFEYDDYRAMKVDYLGNVYVAGAKTGTPVSGVDMLVEKLSPTLVPIWSKTWSQTGNPDIEQALTMDLHPNGTVYIAGDAPIPTKIASGMWIYTSQGANTKFIRFLGNDGYGRVSTVRVQGNRLYVFGSFRGNSLVQANEGSLFSNVYTTSGSTIYNRLTIGNSTISRNTVGGAVAPDGSFLHIANTTISGNTSDSIVQGARFSPQGVYLGLSTVNLPNSVYGEGGMLFDLDHGGLYYSSFSGNGNRTFYAPIVGNVLQSNQAVALNLAGQKIDKPSQGPSGDILVPYTQNGAAGVRVFTSAGANGNFVGEEVKAGGKVSYTYHANTLAGNVGVRVRLYVAGQETPFQQFEWDFLTGDPQREGSADLPAAAQAGGFLLMTVQQINDQGKAVGPATTSFISVVP